MKSSTSFSTSTVTSSVREKLCGSASFLKCSKIAGHSSRKYCNSTETSSHGESVPTPTFASILENAMSDGMAGNPQASNMIKGIIAYMEVASAEKAADENLLKQIEKQIHLCTRPSDAELLKNLQDRAQDLRQDIDKDQEQIRMAREDLIKLGNLQ